ncbi:MAG: hypothetical protein RLZZ399_2322 [Verrucomicrobiota bacterium]|jgi:sialate O-acetylesterase
MNKATLFLVFWWLVASASAAVRPASVFQDHMVLQREKPVAVWGLALPDEKVSVSFAGQVKEARADASGMWRASLDPMAASSEGRELRLTGKGGEAIVIRDVLVGEVWLASGQSNMGIGLGGALNAKEEVAGAHYPPMRFFSVPTRGSLEPQTETDGKWQVVSPTSAMQMSAVAYFFARELVRKLEVPVGVLVSAVGGTPAEAWTPPEVFDRVPEWKEGMLEKVDAFQKDAHLEQNFPEAFRAWCAANQRLVPGGSRLDWAAPDLPLADWQKVSGRLGFGKPLGLPAGGVVWLRKEFEAPESKAGKAVSLWVDALDRQELTLYVNGKEVAILGRSAPRYYQSGLVSVPVPEGVIRAGRNVLAIRCVAWNGNTVKGFTAPNLRLPVANPKELSDEWLAKVEHAFPDLSAEAAAAQPQFGRTFLFGVPGSLYHAMVHPLIPYTLRGAIWYQGESNVSAAGAYRELLSGMIGAWRALWGQGDFPFYLVQLANYHKASDKPAPVERPNPDDLLGRLREAQWQVVQTVPETAMAVTIDTGVESIHPPNKQDVGDRLARLALARTYGRAEVQHQSPVYDSMTREGDAIRVKFRDCPGGLVTGVKKGPGVVEETPGEKPGQFAIAGADHQFVWADARIEGDSVIVSSSAVKEPVAVRYAWLENPKGANVYGKNGLPAAPFRTDGLPLPVNPSASKSR